MAETTVIAAQQRGPVGWLSRFSRDQWPVCREDLDRVIERMAGERGMRVLSVDEPMRRGPIPIYDIDDEGHHVTDAEGNLVVLADVAQLYAYVDWEPLGGDV